MKRARRWTGLWFGCLLAVGFWPQLSYGDVFAIRWAVGWVGVAGLLWLTSTEKSEVQYWGLALITLGLLSGLWGEIKLDWANELLEWVCLLGIFVVGARDCGTAESVIEGFAWGLVAQLPLVLWQFAKMHLPGDLQPMWFEVTSPSGLFGNRDFLAEAAAITIVWALWRRKWILVLGIFPEIILTSYRGAFLVLSLATILWLWQNFSRKLAILSILVFGITGALISTQSNKSFSLTNRVAIWEDTLHDLTPLGHGLGQYFVSMADQSPDRPLERFDHAHSDFLELTYELGLLGLLLLLGFVTSVLRWGRAAPDCAASFAAFCGLALVGFPLHNAPTAVLGVCAAGGVWGAWSRVCSGAGRESSRAAGRSILQRPYRAY